MLFFSVWILLCNILKRVRPKMSAQYSTALSDAILALSSLYTAVALYRVSSFATVGFLLMTMAACLGAVRFSQRHPSDSLVARHKYMSQLTASLGLPLIAFAYTRHWQRSLSYAILVVSLGFFACQQYFDKGLVRKLGAILSGISMLLVLVQSVIFQNVCGILGVVCFAFAGLVIKTDGYFNSIPRVDLFHYALVLANVLLKEGLLVSQLPSVYYTQWWGREGRWMSGFCSLFFLFCVGQIWHFSLKCPKSICMSESVLVFDFLFNVN